MTSSNELSNNTALGDIAGGNISKNTFIVQQNKSPLKVMLEKLSLDCLNDPHFKQYISDLQHYTTSVHPEKQIDLKAKLEMANRADEYTEALFLKEQFAKQLYKNGLSEQAQVAYVHILSKLKLDFQLKIKPRIKESASLTEIGECLHQIINEMYGELAGTPLEQEIGSVHGMLYFLTGNCHIEWTAS